MIRNEKFKLIIQLEAMIIQLSRNGINSGREYWGALRVCGSVLTVRVLTLLTKQSGVSRISISITFRIFFEAALQWKGWKHRRTFPVCYGCKWNPATGMPFHLRSSPLMNYSKNIILQYKFAVWAITQNTFHKQAVCYRCDRCGLSPVYVTYIGKGNKKCAPHWPNGLISVSVLSKACEL